MTTQTPDAAREAQDKSRLALIERIGTIADMACQKPLEGELGDIAYDLLRRAAAQISSDRLRLAALDSRAGDAGEEIENGYTADDAVDFVFNRLASKLGLADWQVVEGSEEWEGDVSATLHRLLIDAGIIDDETGAVATLATPAPAVDATTLVQRFRDASRGLGRAGTTEWPGGLYMSMADAGAVYADLMQGGTGRGVIADEVAIDAVPADVFPATIGRVHLGERRSDGERLCNHGHPVPAGHPLYWPQQISQYDDSDPLCLAHAIDQLESDNAEWGEDYEAVDAVPAGEVDDLDTPEARLDMVRIPLRRIVDDPKHAVAYAKAALDLIDKTEAERAEMRGEA